MIYGSINPPVFSRLPRTVAAILEPIARRLDELVAVANRSAA